MPDAIFVAVSDYQVMLEEIDAHLDEHRVWALEQYAAGRMLASGRRTPPVGGVLIFRAESQSAAEVLVATDPFVGRGFTDYTVYAFTPTPDPWRSAAYASFVASPLEA